MTNLPLAVTMFRFLITLRVKQRCTVIVEFKKKITGLSQVCVLRALPVSEQTHATTEFPPLSPASPFLLFHNF